VIERFLHRIDEAKKDTAVIAFGRMNPPTIGHGVLVDKIVSEAQKHNADHFIFASETQDSKKNPLSHKQKVAYLKKFFPKGNFPVGMAKDPYTAVLYVCSLGYKNIIMVAGSDQVENFKNIAKYKGKVADRDPKKRVYSFEKFEVVQAGEARDDDSQGVEGMSASKMRSAAFDGDFKKFATGVPGKDNATKKKMYSDVRKGLSLGESYISEAVNPSDKVTILALTSSEKDLSDTIEKMQEICKKRKIEFYAVKTSKAQVEISNVTSKKITIKNYDGEGKDITVIPSDTVAVVRGGVMNSDIGVAIMTILQNNGVFMINERGGMELCANKLETAIALKKHNLPHPRTTFVADESNIETAVKEIGGKFPVIVKTLTGAEGIGVSKIESMESLKSVLQTLWKYNAEIIMQEFLPDFKNDVRSICLNGKIFACAKRDKAPKDFRTNIARGSKGGAFQLSDEEIKLVEEAARVSKCYYVGVDHVINDGKPYIIEMNASPGSGNIYYRYYEDGKGKNNVEGKELVEDFVEYILNKSNWKLFSNLTVRETVKIDGVEYEAKVDTGNSGYNMIHGEDIKDNGNHTVTFKLSNGKKITKKIVSRIIVKSGIGEKKRLVIFMDIEFHGKKYPNIKFSIGDRNHMSTKVLLGLQFLSKTGMLVDPAEAIYPQNQTKKEEHVNLNSNTLYEKLTKNGQLKELNNRYEQDDAFERLAKIDQSDTTNNNKIRLSIAYEERCLTRNMQDGAYLARTYIEFLKEIRNSELGSNQPKTDINEDFEFFLLEVSPPKGAARSFSKDEKTKASFRKQYGKRWKEVFYATAWKMHGEDVEPSETWLDEAKKINNVLKWTSMSKRGPLLIGTDKIVKTYKHDTPGERKEIEEDKPCWVGFKQLGMKMKNGKKVPNCVSVKEDTSEEEMSDLYKEWQKLVNMSGKEIDTFLDSDDGTEAGLSRKEAGKAGADGGKISTGRDSARAIIRMLDTPMEKWSDNDWKWAGKQVNFINRMKGAKGPLRDEDKKPTRKLLALKVWGHNPEKGS
jgi:RimK family alpha-L-glutamate ligase